MEGSFNSFSLVEYLSVFTAFVFGYVATRFFSGWGAMINFRHSINFSKEHLLWTLIIFGLLIDNWWGSWIKGNFLHQTLLFYISLLPPFVFYLISVLLFPPLNDNKFHDLRKHFQSVQYRMYLILIGLFVAFMINDYFFKRSFVINYYLNGLAILVALVGYFSKSLIVHRVILLIGCGMLLFHIISQPVIWKDNIEGFSMTEYLTIFIAFIYGSVASRFFSGWGAMISKFDQIVFNIEHLAWTLLIFVLLLDFWTGSWPREKFIAININYFLLTLFVPMTFFALTAVLFPNIRNGESIDLGLFFETNKKIMFLLFAITMLANMITANVMEEQLMDIENLFRLIAITFSVMAFRTVHISLERFVLILGWCMMIVHAAMETYIP